MKARIPGVRYSTKTEEAPKAEVVEAKAEAAAVTEPKSEETSQAADVGAPEEKLVSLAELGRTDPTPVSDNEIVPLSGMPTLPPPSIGGEPEGLSQAQAAKEATPSVEEAPVSGLAPTIAVSTPAIPSLPSSSPASTTRTQTPTEKRQIAEARKATRAAATGRACPLCGGSNAEDATHCVACGASMDAKSGSVHATSPSTIVPEIDADPFAAPPAAPEAKKADTADKAPPATSSDTVKTVKKTDEKKSVFSNMTLFFGNALKKAKEAITGMTDAKKPATEPKKSESTGFGPATNEFFEGKKGDDAPTGTPPTATTQTQPAHDAAANWALIVLGLIAGSAVVVAIIAISARNGNAASPCKDLTPALLEEYYGQKDLAHFETETFPRKPNDLTVGEGAVHVNGKVWDISKSKAKLCPK